MCWGIVQCLLTNQGASHDKRGALNGPCWKHTCAAAASSRGWHHVRAVAATTGLASITGNVGGCAKRTGESLSSASSPLLIGKTAQCPYNTPGNDQEQIDGYLNTKPERGNEKHVQNRKSWKKKFFARQRSFIFEKMRGALDKNSDGSGRTKRMEETHRESGSPTKKLDKGFSKSGKLGKFPEIGGNSSGGGGDNTERGGDINGGGGNGGKDQEVVVVDTRGSHGSVVEEENAQVEVVDDEEMEDSSSDPEMDESYSQLNEAMDAAKIVMQSERPSLAEATGSLTQILEAERELRQSGRKLHKNVFEETQKIKGKLNYLVAANTVSEARVAPVAPAPGLLLAKKISDAKTRNSMAAAADSLQGADKRQVLFVEPQSRWVHRVFLTPDYGVTSVKQLDTLLKSIQKEGRLPQVGALLDFEFEKDTGHYIGRFREVEKEFPENLRLHFGGLQGTSLLISSTLYSAIDLTSILVEVDTLKRGAKEKNTHSLFQLFTALQISPAVVAMMPSADGYHVVIETMAQEEDRKKILEFISLRSPLWRLGASDQANQRCSIAIAEGPLLHQLGGTDPSMLTKELKSLEEGMIEELKQGNQQGDHINRLAQENIVILGVMQSKSRLIMACSSLNVKAKVHAILKYAKLQLGDNSAIELDPDIGKIKMKLKGKKKGSNSNPKE